MLFIIKMCLESFDEVVPYDPSIDPTSCIKCYHRNYYKKFTFCPGAKCTLTQCEKSCEDNKEDEKPLINCCCNTHPTIEPPCASCSIIFCPIAMIIDIVSCPIRLVVNISCNCCENSNSNHINVLDNNLQNEKQTKLQEITEQP